MNVLTHIVAGAVAGGIAATGVVLLVAPTPTTATTDTESTAVALRALEARLASMESSQAASDERYEQLATSVTTRLSSVNRQPVAAAAAVEAGDPAVAAGDLAAAAAPDREAAVEDLMAQLLATGLGDMESAELWKRAIDEGLIDDLVARFEERVAADPDDPDAHVDLGSAYIQKIQEVGNSPLAGLWAGKADEAFDAALELDEDHWGARMSKAVSLSFWPPIFGKQAEAVNQFQTLIDKQKGMPLDSSHESPYVLLGNLHWQRGDTEQALSVWNEGLGLFPDSSDLAAALANADG